MSDKNNTPMVSVVITTYNRENYLRESISSVLSQTYQDFELIIVDNFSDYNFFELIEEFNSDKIKAFQNKNNGIIARNRNYGIEKAIGKYIAFCDDDDIWLPNKLDVQIKAIEEKRVDIISSALIVFGDGVEEEEVRVRKYSSEYKYYCLNYVTPSSVLLRNSKDVRFNENPAFNCAEDWALWMKLYILGYKLCQLPDPLVKYRITKQSMTKRDESSFYIRGAKILKELRKEYGRRFKTKYFLFGLLYQYWMPFWNIVTSTFYPLYCVLLGRNN